MPDAERAAWEGVAEYYRWLGVLAANAAYTAASPDAADAQWEVAKTRFDSALAVIYFVRGDTDWQPGTRNNMLVKLFYGLGCATIEAEDTGEWYLEDCLKLVADEKEALRCQADARARLTRDTRMSATRQSCGDSGGGWAAALLDAILSGN